MKAPDMNDILRTRGPDALRENLGHGTKYKSNGRNGSAQHDGKWIDRCIKDKGNGRPIPNLANAMIALRSDAAIKEAFAFDEMLRAVMLQHPIRPMKCTAFAPRPATDLDVGELQEWLQIAGLHNVGKDT